MPLQNRVTPLSELIATPHRGLVYGNRGCLHDPAGRIRRRYSGKRWIACRLRFRDWHREPLMQPGRFTELFFLDEATALAAGHRPCALCRRPDYDRLVALLGRHSPARDATEPTRSMRSSTVSESTCEPVRSCITTSHSTSSPTVRSCCGTAPVRLVRGARLLRWTPAGYVEPTSRPRGQQARVITPRSLVSILRAGWEPLVPLLHPSAGAWRGSVDS